MSRRFVGLEYIRGIAAIGVAGCHYVVSIGSSGIAELLSILFVEAFFPLSGFVLASQIRTIATDVTEYKTFLARRWLRTLPAYFVALATIGLLSSNVSLTDTLMYALFVSYLTKVFVTVDFYPVAWSLAVEEWYYIVVPIILVTIARTGRVTLFKAGVFLLIVIYVAKIMCIAYDMVEQYRTLTWVRLDAILMGYLFYEWHNAVDKLKHIATITIFAFVALPILFIGQDLNELGDVSTVFALLLISIGFSGLITLAYEIEKRGLIKFGSVATAIGIWLGRLSYNIYLFHLVVILLLERIGLLDSALLYLGVLALFGVLFFFSFESPILKIRPSYKSGKRFG